MPFPIAHSLAGATVHTLAPDCFFSSKKANLVFCVFISLLPDADFIPGLVLNSASLFHHGISHTLGAAIVFALTSAVFFKKKSYIKALSLIFLMYYMHVVMDVFTEDTKEPFGVMLFWPFFKDYINSPLSLFSRTYRSEDPSLFFQSLFNLKNFLPIMKEFIIMTPVLLLAWKIKTPPKDNKQQK